MGYDYWCFMKRIAIHLEIDGLIAEHLYGWKWLEVIDRRLTGLVPPKCSKWIRHGTASAEDPFFDTIWRASDAKSERFSDWHNFGGPSSHVGMVHGGWGHTIPPFSSDHNAVAMMESDLPDNLTLHYGGMLGSYLGAANMATRQHGWLAIATTSPEIKCRVLLQVMNIEVPKVKEKDEY